MPHAFATPFDAAAALITHMLIRIRSRYDAAFARFAPHCFCFLFDYAFDFSRQSHAAIAAPCADYRLQRSLQLKSRQMLQRQYATAYDASFIASPHAAHSHQLSAAA